MENFVLVFIFLPTFFRIDSISFLGMTCVLHHRGYENMLFFYEVELQFPPRPPLLRRAAWVKLYSGPRRRTGVRLSPWLKGERQNGKKGKDGGDEKEEEK
jgi:hypothetical protein